jgi:hypothetical protein
MEKVRIYFSRTLLFTVVVLGSVAGTAHAGDKIPVVESGRVSVIDSEDYTKTLQAAFSSVYESTLPALQAAAPSDSGSLHLKTVTVGIGATASFSLGSIGGISVTPKASLIFSNGPIGDDPNF